MSRTGDPVPLVVACLRITDLRPEVDPLTGTVRRDARGVGLPPADAAALEHALRLAAGLGGRAAAVSVAARSADPVLRDVAALGVEVLRVPTSGGEDRLHSAGDLTADEDVLAARVVDALATVGHPSVVVCGDRSVDRATGAFPAYLAHRLGAAQALGLVSLGVDDDGRGGPALVGERRLDGGWRERLRIPLPAVCSVEAAGVRLRRASLTGALDQADRPVPVASGLPTAQGDGSVHTGSVRPFTPRTRVVPPPVGDDPRHRLAALTGVLVAHDPPTVVGPVDADAAADELLAFLDRHGYRGTPGDR